MSGHSEGDAAERLELVVRALEKLPVGIVVENAEGETIVSNQRGLAPFGELAADALAGATREKAIAQARSGRDATEVLDLYGPQPRRLEVIASPLHEGAVVAVLVDVTERRRLDAIRRDFIANVNHELRTPIGALGVLSEALAGERDLATVDRLAARISAEVGRARALIEDLLDFARVEVEEQPIHVPVQLLDVVNIAESRVHPLAEQREITIVASEVEESCTVDGDRDQLVMAVANLLDNALKYSEPHTTVRVATSTEGDRVVLSVADEGLGIPARDLDRIFERFYRVDSARDRSTGGTGLGLAIVRHVAANHGGDVSVRSREGVGSVFTIRLPRSEGGR